MIENLNELASGQQVTTDPPHKLTLPPTIILLLACLIKFKKFKFGRMQMSLKEVKKKVTTCRHKFIKITWWGSGYKCISLLIHAWAR